MTGFAKRSLIHAIINIEKSRFEILNTVYLENAWCAILHQSIIIQGNSVGVPFNGLVAELPFILDSCFTSTTSYYIEGSWSGAVGSHRSDGENRRCAFTLILWIHWWLKWPKKEDKLGR